MQRQILAVVLIVIVLILLIARDHQSARIHAGVKGLWVASPDFCNRSEIDGMLVYVGSKASGFWDATHKAHIIMYSDGQIILQTNLILDITPSWMSQSDANLHITCCDPEIDLQSVMPQQQTLHYDPAIGCMTWTAPNLDQPTVYAELYRDNIASLESLESLDSLESLESINSRDEDQMQKTI